jgi:hypothetical protein
MPFLSWPNFPRAQLAHAAFLFSVCSLQADGSFYCFFGSGGRLFPFCVLHAGASGGKLISLWFSPLPRDGRSFQIETTIALIL